MLHGFEPRASDQSYLGLLYGFFCYSFLPVPNIEIEILSDIRQRSLDYRGEVRQLFADLSSQLPECVLEGGFEAYRTVQ